MKQLGIAALFITITSQAFGQRFIQQNTGTLFDSFENPSQRAFIPDSSRYIAFNFFIPNGGTNSYLKGNAQSTIKSRLSEESNFNWFSNNLQIGGENNHTRINLNEYWLMARFFGKLGANTEYGFSIQSRADGYGVLSDESFLLFDRYTRFPQNSYQNIFNDKVYAQAWHQVSFTYKEDLEKYIGIGFKFSALSGVSYTNLNVNRSALNIDRAADNYILSLGGTYYTNFSSGQFEKRTLWPRFTNPGAAVTFGGWYVSPGGIKIQAHVKDLGFIYWRQETARKFDFNTSRRLDTASASKRELRTITQVMSILESRPVQQSFTKPIDSRLEAMISRPFYITNNKQLVYKPTLILSKYFFDNRFDAALLNQLSYRSISGSLSAHADDNNYFAVGGQFMVKSPNVDFFIGSESLYESYQSTKAFVFGDVVAQQSNLRQFGASIFFGFALKFGRYIESPMNASYIPMGEKSFFGKLYSRIFKTRD